MARVSLQIKNGASLVLAAGASTFWGVFAKRFFDTPAKPAGAFAAVGALLLACQFALIFVESKEEEELSLFREERMTALRHFIQESEKLSDQIQKEIKSGNLESAERWTAFRREHYEK